MAIVLVCCLGKSCKSIELLLLLWHQSWQYVFLDLCDMMFDLKYCSLWYLTRPNGAVFLVDTFEHFSYLEYLR